MSLLPKAMPISARSLSNEDIISVNLFFWWLVISFSFCSSESMEAKELWCWMMTLKHISKTTTLLAPCVASCNALCVLTPVDHIFPC